MVELTKQTVIFKEKFIREHPTERLWFQHRRSTISEEITALQNEGVQEGI